MSKILGVDFGLKKIGLAMSDAEAILAFPRETIRYDKAQEGLDRVIEYARAEKVKKIVVGLPKNMNGGESAQTEKTRTFGQKLEEAGFEVRFEDERMTTIIAEKNGEKSEADALAAQLILQSFIERQLLT